MTLLISNGYRFAPGFSGFFEIEPLSQKMPVKPEPTKGKCKIIYLGYKP
jgi:hypothetical protein